MDSRKCRADAGVWEPVGGKEKLCVAAWESGGGMQKPRGCVNT